MVMPANAGGRPACFLRAAFARDDGFAQVKALQIQAISADLSGAKLVDTSRPVPSPGEALIHVRAASLNFPDLLMTRGEYQLKPSLPFVPGMDLAGEVVSAPEESGLTIGARVMGGVRLGAMAEYACVPVSALRAIPAGIDDPAAAAFGAAYSTAYTALVEIGGLTAGQWVLVHGASGGVGLGAVDLALALGARVIATSGSADKCAALGALFPEARTVLAQGRFREQVAALTGGALCDMVYDPVGGDVFDESTRCVAFGGKLLVIGFTSGRIADISTNIPLIKGFAVVGVRAGEYARRFPERGLECRDAVHGLLAEGKIKPHIDRVLPLAQWREGFSAMAERKLVGKVVFAP